MNKQRRKRLDELADKITQLQAELEVLRDDADSIRMEERDAFEAMSEGLQQSENGQKIEQCADLLDELFDAVDGAVEGLQEAINKCQEAAE